MAGQQAAGIGCHGNFTHACGSISCQNSKGSKACEPAALKIMNAINDHSPVPTTTLAKLPSFTMATNEPKTKISTILQGRRASCSRKSAASVREVCRVLASSNSAVVQHNPI